MFTYQTKVHLRDTDATGVLFFTEQLRMALEALEEYLKTSGISLSKIIAENAFLLPIVHAESDYYAPLFIGDPLSITLKAAKIGESSFTLEYHFFHGETKKEVGSAAIVHVVVSRESKASIPIPESLLELLRKLSA